MGNGDSGFTPDTVPPVPATARLHGDSRGKPTLRRVSCFLLTPWVIILLQAQPGAHPQAPGSESLARIYDEGNQLYQKGDFSSAESCYSRLVNSGVDSGAVYYNLGNACFKQKKLGEAIYYWEKARQKLPGDREVLENLELAQLMIVDRIEIPADPFPLRVLFRLIHFLTLSQLAWAVLMLFIAGNVLFGTYILVRSPGTAARVLVGSLISLLLVALTGGMLAWRIYENHFRQTGIIVEQKVDVRSGPGADNVTVFTVHEGIPIRVRGSANGWYQVTLPNGWSGWLETRSVRIL
jgi:hypothetical protein